MEAVLQWLQENWGNLASVAGLTGVVLALWQLARTKKAAEAAREAAEETAKAVGIVLTISDLERAIALLERVKEYHRANKWDVAVTWYSQISSLLADIRAKSSLGIPESLGSIEKALSQLGVMEAAVDQALRDNRSPQNMEIFIKVLIDTQQDLREMIGVLQQTLMSEKR